jgi:CheY-like chemotaxis protein
MLRLRFWGTRGSLPKPGPTTVRHGGNTSCVEVRTGDGTLIVLDCGTGAHGLGESLLAPEGGSKLGHLLITHTHWDHIQGFPFFRPLFVAGNEWDIYAPGGLGQQIEATLAGQMQYTYFPVTLAQLGAVIRYHDLSEGRFSVGPVGVTARYLNHPALALGYRLEIGGVSLVYAVDHEPHGGPIRGDVAPGAPLVHAEDRRHVEFLAGADLVIHDAQFTSDEYRTRQGWGHSPVEWAVDYAVAAGARRLALYHHDPLRDDDSLDRLVETCRARAAASGSPLQVFAAAEGMVLELSGPAAPHLDGRPALPVAVLADGVTPPSTILVADDDPSILLLLENVLVPEGFRVVTAADGPQALEQVRQHRPDLILLDWTMPGLEGVEVARILRSQPEPYFKEVPVVLVTARDGADSTHQGFAAGVTDYLTKPFKVAHLLTRVRAWLLRSGKGAATPAP